MGGVVEWLCASAEERPEKRQRKNAPINPVQGRFYFRLFFVGTRGVTNGEANGEPRGQRPKDHRNRIFPKEQFGPFPRETPSSPDLFKIGRASCRERV